MNPEIQIRKTSDGRIQARRLDGKPLTPEDREEAKRLAVIEELPPPHACVVDEVCDGNSLKAIKVCSAMLQDHLWLIIDRTFKPIDGLAIYYAEELSELGNKTLEQLREIHRVKLAFPGARVIQEGAGR